MPAAVKCDCGNECPLRQVQKEGRNKGKWFYSCAKLNGDDCKFFKFTTDKPFSDIPPAPYLNRKHKLEETLDNIPLPPTYSKKQNT